MWKLLNNKIKNNETGYYTNIHFTDHFCVNIDSKQSVIKEYPSNVPKMYSCDLSTATIEYSCLSVCVSVCLCACVSLCTIT